MSKRIRDEAGFGLVELLIAMTIMSIGIFAVVAGFSSGIETNRARKQGLDGRRDRRQGDGGIPRGVHGIADPPRSTVRCIDPTGRRNRTALTAVATSSPRCSCRLSSAPTDSSTAALTCAANGGTIGRPVKTVTVTVSEGAAARRQRS